MKKEPLETIPWFLHRVSNLFFLSRNEGEWPPRLSWHEESKNLFFNFFFSLRDREWSCSSSFCFIHLTITIDVAFFFQRTSSVCAPCLQFWEKEREREKRAAKKKKKRRRKQVLLTPEKSEIMTAVDDTEMSILCSHQSNPIRVPGMKRKWPKKRRWWRWWEKRPGNSFNLPFESIQTRVTWKESLEESKVIHFPWEFKGAKNCLVKEKKKLSSPETQSHRQGESRKRG